ncbi:alpha-glucosidase [Hespellia stercorisuis]|uniref:Oligo-1,6-glucosidase n=1 Tax=Hespellia stercorisuis DSM 15480 TaxID=1121950 RepID=A0A1M6NXG1_9FIRM|nr:alpha-glucosidase [Hespellia stercorisuis]SHK00415.1 oligo-1,6-glucosidase [Hespellia stercorisuis DSM 15480]
MKKKWWHEKVAYQVYPKSFRDTNGDGIGDLRGIIEKLDYFKELGVDIIWLSPIFCSPMADQGYDISDYYNIDPMFGTMEDMDELLAEAKKRDLHVLMDLVVNHCSDEHEWFKQAMKDPDGKYGKYFYIEEGKDGKVPCNWRSYFGGSVWEPIPGTNKYYLHMFHKKQPDLNWENEEVREEIYKMINWWLDKGLSGFRIDAIINIKKVLPFRDYPADRDDGTAACTVMLKDAVGVMDFLNEMADRTFRPHNAFTAGEVFNEKKEELPDFIGDDGCFSTMFDFNETVFGESDRGWYDFTRITPDDYKRCCFETQERIDDVGLISNVIENHDEPRGVSRYIPEGDCTDTSKKMLATMSMMLKGLPFIYQGQELGMENIGFNNIDEVDDIATIDQYHVALDAGCSEREALDIIAYYSRDNARTPFQWDESDNAGFTSGKPWLRVNPNYTKINAKDQVGRADSVFAYYQKLIALRKNPEYKETIIYGKLVPYMEDEKNLMAYYRKGENQTLLVIGNYQNESRVVKLPASVKSVLLNNYDDAAISSDGTIHLEGYQAVVMEL